MLYTSNIRGLGEARHWLTLNLASKATVIHPGGVTSVNANGKVHLNDIQKILKFMRKEDYLTRSTTLPSSLDKRRTLLEGSKMPFHMPNSCLQVMLQNLAQ
jgi:hypothetical protein